MTTLKKISAIACLFIAAFLICRTASAQETKTFIAYSMKVAQARVEEAMRKGEDFRKKQPDLFYLGGITKPWAVVLDTENNDWILVGERDPKSSVLTLDDWVVALRARFIYPDKDPGVTIDPRPCEACVKAGKKEGCSHYIKQDVRFFGGIEDTHFGQVCYEADWLMKKIAFSLEKLPVNNFKSYFDLCAEQIRNSGSANSSVSSRFWFFPIVNQVSVIGDVVLLEKFKMGVFTEVHHAEINGKPVADIDKFNHYPSEGFSRSFSENYDAAAQAREVLETLRGLTRLAALAKGLTQVDGKPKVDFFLCSYSVEKSEIPKDVEVLKNENREIGFLGKGGVELMALTMRLKGGDASALMELVLKGRKASGVNTLTWCFETKVQNDQLVGVIMPKELRDSSQIVPLFQQAVFLHKKAYYDDAINLYGKVIELKPNWNVPYLNRGAAYYVKREYDCAIADLSIAIDLDPRDAKAYINRGSALSDKGLYDCAISDFNKAIGLDPIAFEAYFNRGRTYYDKGEVGYAISDYERVQKINPNFGSEDSTTDELIQEMQEIHPDFGKNLKLITLGRLLRIKSYIKKYTNLKFDKLVIIEFIKENLAEHSIFDLNTERKFRESSSFNIKKRMDDCIPMYLTKNLSIGVYGSAKDAIKGNILSEESYFRMFKPEVFEVRDKNIIKFNVEVVRFFNFIDKKLKLYPFAFLMKNNFTNKIYFGLDSQNNIPGWSVEGIKNQDKVVDWGIEVNGQMISLPFNIPMELLDYFNN